MIFFVFFVLIFFLENGLEDVAFKTFPVGQIKPAGWLLNQLQLQANGFEVSSQHFPKMTSFVHHRLAGHLQYFYPYISNSTWIGAKKKGTSSQEIFNPIDVGGDVADPYQVNERVPYWLNGITFVFSLSLTSFHVIRHGPPDLSSVR